MTSMIEMTWPEPMSPKAWDTEFPGALDSIALMGGSANVIMQLAHPSVGYGVMESRVESGALFKHPIKRARTTITYLAVAMVGSTEEKLAYRKAVNRVHAQVTSLPSSPVKYHAMDPGLQLWVAACLYKGYFDSFQLLRGGMDRDQAERFYKLSAPLGTTLQVRAESWPPTLEAFEEYWQAGISNVHIDEKTRAYLSAIANLKFMHKPTQWLFARFHRFVTIGYLPQALREQMYYDWSEKDEQRFHRFMRVVGTLNRHLPRFIRQGPFLLLMQDFRRRLKNRTPLV